MTQLLASTMSGLEWCWWVGAVGGLLLAWSLTPIRPRRSGGSAGRSGESILAIYPLLWSRGPAETADLLKRQPGVRAVDLDLAHGRARVIFDPHLTSTDTLASFIEECSRHCVGTRARDHSCPPDLKAP